MTLRTSTLILSEAAVVLTETKAAEVGWLWFQVELPLLT